MRFFAFARTARIEAALALDLHENHLLFNYTENSDDEQTANDRGDPRISEPVA